MRTFIIFLLLLWSSVSQGQFFNRRYTLGSGGLYFDNIIIADSSIYVGGSMATSDGIYKQKMFFTEFSYSGDSLHHQFFELDTFTSYFPMQHSAHVQGGVINFCGGLGPGKTARAFSARIDLNTLNLSLQEYQDTSMSRFWVNSSITLSSGNIIYIGEFETQNFNIGYFILKTNSIGIEISRKYFPLWSDEQDALQILSLHNGYLLIGSQHGQYLPGTYNYSASQLIEIDTLGNQVKYWDDAISLGRTYAPTGIIELPGGDRIYATNYLDSQQVYPSQTNVYRSGYLVRLDTANNKVWDLRLGMSSAFTDFMQVKALSDGNFLAIGNDLDSIDNPSDPFQAGWLVKFSSQGRVIWERHYYSEKYFNYLYDFVELSNGDIIACGQVVNIDVQVNSQQGWLLHLDRDGCLGDRCTTGIQNVTSEPTINLYPNPTTYSIHIDGIADDAEYTITNIIGQSLLHGDLNPLHEIDLVSLPSGIYLVDILTDGQHITRKILKQ